MKISLFLLYSISPFRMQKVSGSKSRDYETLTANSEAMIQISMIRLLLKRLT